jgi:hypothetical protein
MNDKKNTKVYQRCNHNSVLVVNKKGICRIYCPFKAECTGDIDIYSKGEIVAITAVKSGKEHSLIYIIRGKSYYHHKFSIINQL